MSPSYEKAYSPGTTVYLIVYVPETEEVTDENGEVIPPEELSEDDSEGNNYAEREPEEDIPAESNSSTTAEVNVPEEEY